jgi:hypothetical protein
VVLVLTAVLLHLLYYLCCSGFDILDCNLEPQLDFPCFYYARPRF